MGESGEEGQANSTRKMHGYSLTQDHISTEVVIFTFIIWAEELLRPSEQWTKNHLTKSRGNRLENTSMIRELSKKDWLKEKVKLVEDLSPHQEELNIQNEELLRVQQDLEATRTKYFELYDLAPVGYITLTPDLIIKEANLTASKLLGIDRKNLFNRGLSAFVPYGSQESLYLHYRRLTEEKEKQVSTFPLCTKDGRDSLRPVREQHHR